MIFIKNFGINEKANREQCLREYTCFNCYFFIVRLFIAAYTGLGIGESYYFRGAVKFELSYFDQPPLFFWIGRLSTQLFGLNAFGLRFPSVLLFAGTCWLLFLVTRLLFNAMPGLLSKLTAPFKVPAMPVLVIVLLTLYSITEPSFLCINLYQVCL
ncbi:glycosyltransferase family 39 protein [Mucilaginibacter sp. PAMB04168]|uniref:ArnT family glycosyltransferase n=1 Tax=Mucilaginibacter sp. PAMB04168 TaxID=3138567 RepID=UPI0033194B2E